MRRLVLLLAGAALLGACGTGGTSESPAALPPVVIQPQAIADPVEAAPATPITVELPSLHVVDDVVPVALDRAGAMELPPVTSVGWYRLAPEPGDVGRAVLAGHVDFGGTDGAFKHLGDMHTGDAVIVTDAHGTVRTFRVYDVRTKLKKADYLQVTVPIVFGVTPQREVALVTCSGTVSEHQYSDNTVVRARLAT